MKKKSLILVLMFSIFVFVSIIGAGYAYWAGSISGNNKTSEGNEVTIGSGQSVTTEVTLGTLTIGGTGKTLVPANKAIGANEVEYVMFTFPVSWKEAGTANNSDGGKPARALSVEVSNVTIGGGTDNINLVGSAIQIGGTAPEDGVLGTSAPSIILDGAAVNVYVKITLTEPTTKAIYDAIKEKTIKFNVTFTVPDSPDL